MVHIEPFEVELWMDKYETQAKYNIAETCAASISISDLLSLSEKPDLPSPISTTTKLTYGAIRGSDALRNNLAALYSARASTPLTKENILITPGAIFANFLVLYTLLSPGDHVICHYPTYSQLYQVPRTLGASVSLWKASASKNWQLDPSTLPSLIQKGKTKLLILNTPNNPTGAIIPRSDLEEIVSIAGAHDITILADEVYRPLFHSLSPSSPSFPPSTLNTPSSSPSKNIVVTGSLSKAYSLAGIRVGWIASPSPTLITAFAQARHFTTISVSALSDAIAATALSDHVVHALLARNIELARTNLQVLERWVEAFRWAVDWVRPVAGTTAWVRFRRNGRAVDDAVLAERLVQKWAVLVVPGGACFEDRAAAAAEAGAEAVGEGEKGKEKKDDHAVPGEFAGYVRIGYVQSTEVLRQALDVMSRFMMDEGEDGFGRVPLWKGK